LIWASRHYEAGNPQNILGRSDCLRILVAWRAFGDLGKCPSLIAAYERELQLEIERELETTLKDIEVSYRGFLQQIGGLREEVAAIEAFAEANSAKNRERTREFLDKKRLDSDRLKDLTRKIKSLEKLENDARDKGSIARHYAECQAVLVSEAAADLRRICEDSTEAARYFVVCERLEIEENEFNLNLPRYVDTFPPEDRLEIKDAVEAVRMAEETAQQRLRALRDQLERFGFKG